MPKLKFGNLELTATYNKGAIPKLDIFPYGPGRSTNSSERIFHYDCDTSTPTPSALTPSREFGASIWCEANLPLSFGTPMLLSEEMRREMDRKANACEQALLTKSGLTPQEFSQALAPDFPKVSARIPVNAIRRLIPNYSFSVYIIVHWMHLHCSPNITPFECITFARFPFAYEFGFIFEKSCNGSKYPTYENKLVYFELSELEKNFERDGLKFQQDLKDMIDKYPLHEDPVGPENNGTGGETPNGH